MYMLQRHVVTLRARPAASWLTALLLLSAGCATDADLAGETDVEESDIGVAEEALHGRLSDLFPSNFAKVCIRTAPVVQNYLFWTREAVRREWEQAAHINLVGWAPCTATEPANRIELHFDHSVITNTVGTVRHIHLERDFREINPATGCAFNDRSCELSRPASEWCRNRDVFGEFSGRYCTQAMAVHEFGHALGFLDEHASAAGQANYSGADGASVMASHALPAIYSDGTMTNLDKSGAAVAYGARKLHRWFWTGSQDFPGFAAAFVGGNEANGTVQLVCRVAFQGGVHIGKWVNGACYIPWGGAEHQFTSNVEILFGPGLFWGGGGPALIGGMENNGTTMIGACRANHAGGVHVGKVVNGGCFIPFGGAEIGKPAFTRLTTN